MLSLMGSDDDPDDECEVCGAPSCICDDEDDETEDDEVNDD